MFDQIIVTFSVLLNNVAQFIYVFFRETWWFFLFVVLLSITFSTWLYWRQLIYKKSQKHILLELQIPREVDKNPKGMEQVLKSLWGLRNKAADINERYWIGEVTRWTSLEMVSFGGEVHFYIRALKKQKDLVKAAFLAYYPNIEMIEVEDYVNNLSKDIDELSEKGFNLWGSEILLLRPSAYPIKTYEEFEEKAEDRTYDPITTFLEVLGGIKKQEIVGIQINIAPSSPDWSRKWDNLIEKLRKPKEEKTGRIKDGFPELKKLPSTPGEFAILKAVEENLSDPAFETIIRFIYISPQSIFYSNFARRGITSAFNQYALMNLNSFRQNYKMSTRTTFWKRPFIFPVWRNNLRKQRILHFYKKREMPELTFMGRVLSSHPLNWNFHSKTIQLTSKAIATLFHPPTRFVLTAPHLKRIDSKKASPEAGLSIFGDGDSLEKFGQDNNPSPRNY